VRQFAERVRALAAALPDAAAPKIAVLSHEQWPLPFYLRRERGVAYHSQAPERLDAPVLVLDTRVADVVLPADAVLVGEYSSLRPGQSWRLYLRRGAIGVDVGPAATRDAPPASLQSPP
jgi:hypothetical protein